LRIGIFQTFEIVSKESVFLMSEQVKKVLLIVFVVLAIGAAVWSGANFVKGPSENVVGDLGDLSKGKGKEGGDMPATNTSATPLPVGKEGELSGGSSASGAPSDASGAPPNAESGGK
jgi:hypothetical protein